MMSMSFTSLSVSPTLSLLYPIMIKWVSAVFFPFNCHPVSFWAYLSIVKHRTLLTSGLGWVRIIICDRSCLSWNSAWANSLKPGKKPVSDMILRTSGNSFSVPQLLAMLISVIRFQTYICNRLKLGFVFGKMCEC